MEFPAQWFAGTGVFGLLLLVFVLAVRLLRLLNAQLDRDKALAHKGALCEKRLSMLVDIAMQHGWQFPAAFWEDHVDDTNA